MKPSKQSSEMRRNYRDFCVIIFHEHLLFTFMFLFLINPKPVHANNCDETKFKLGLGGWIGTAVIVGIMGIYDIAKAAKLAKLYNENLSNKGFNHTPADFRFQSDLVNNFGQPRFSSRILYDSSTHLDEYSIEGSTSTLKNPSIAFILSLGATVLPPLIALSITEENETKYATTVAAAVTGPSIGHFYAEQHRRAIKGIVTRSAVGALNFVLLKITVEEFDDCDY